MNPNILTNEVQDYINDNLNADANKIALAKSPFVNVSSAELATQIIAKRKAKQKLPTWYNAENIYFPPVLSIEQTSSESTAHFKSTLAKGEVLLDLTAGLGVDSFYFAKKVKQVYSCEINEELSHISTHNAKSLNATNITCLATDGLEFIKNTATKIDTIFVDPARRNTSGKVFKLADCTPNIVAHLDLLLNKCERIIVKTSPLLDISAGLSELKNVSEIHILSVKNECKELDWVIDGAYNGNTKIICASINGEAKIVTIPLNELKQNAVIADNEIAGYLYEPDVALMKSGAFDWIAYQFNLKKLESQSHLYIADVAKPEFVGRIFEIKSVISLNELKKSRGLKGNVIVRNFPDQAENLVKKYKIESAREEFIIFTKNISGYVVLFADIIQYF